jgi:hypothetical protein
MRTVLTQVVKKVREGKQKATGGDYESEIK